MKNFNNNLDILTIGGGKLTFVEYIRCYALLTLVMWHCLCIYLGWGGYLPDVQAGIAHSPFTHYQSLFAQFFIPDANMPLFTSISGFVYSFLYHHKNKYHDFKQVLISKTKRLLIPYCVLGTLVVLTIFDWSPFGIITGNAHHLWYCLMLFWCFILIQGYHHMGKWAKIVVILFSVALQYQHITVPIPGLNRTADYFGFFLFGYYLPFFLKSINKWFYALPILIIYVATFYIPTFFPVHVVRGYLLILMLFMNVPINIRPNKVVSTLGKYSFGIYVFHEWFLWNAAHLHFVQEFAIEHQIMYPIYAFLIVFPISTLLTHYSLKTKIGKFLLS